ncbi:hypothetical protein ASG52_00830 [Methylobacterium sp. Leaf456]|uniref:glycosyltransferase 61 family protein n=1 Tax=Methylobacterium sp. Leaf456 TaxID=1736382 RepID=UPI0006F6AD8A|nr:glycosyltransferase 61 family protein [Methylobacterium sp. Leaf456]KQT61467.1 hypothetical protein ASG52_00830 [Methylobacterium sp. Leaf456]
MQPVSRDVVEALEARIREHLPISLKDQASDMAAILLRAMGDGARDLQVSAIEADLAGLVGILLRTLGTAAPERRDSLATVFGERLSRFRETRQRPDQDAERAAALAALALLVTVGAPTVSFHYKNLGEVLVHSGRAAAALRWIEHARRLHARDFPARPPMNRNDRIVYAMFLRDEAHCHAELGNFSQAIDLKLKAHALNSGDPDYSAIEAWSKEPSVDEPVHAVSVGAYERLPALLLKTSSILIAPSQDQGREIFKLDDPGRELPSPRIFGHVGHGFVKESQAATLSLRRFERVRIYTEYWKTAVTDDAGRLLRSVSSGPAEVACLADRCGLGQAYADLPGVTAVVTYNHNWLEYYHWLIEITQRVGLLIESGAAFDNLIAPGAAMRSYCQEFLSLTGLAAKNVLDDQEPIAVRAEAALIPSRPRMITAFGIDFLRTLYLGRSPVRADAKRRLLISRRKAKNRRIVNDEQVHDLLSKLGFETVTFEDMDVRAQAKLMSEAEIVVAPHGAGLSNVVFCPPGATVIELLPVGCPVVFQFLSQKCDLDYVAVQSDWSGQDQVVDLDHLRAALRSTGLS